MKINKKEIESRMLNTEQAETVKMMIIASMRGAYIQSGALPDEGFQKAASQIADQVIKNTQMALMQVNVYRKAVESTKPLKVSKKKKNARK